jgi:hypothetical protein
MTDTSSEQAARRDTSVIVDCDPGAAKRRLRTAGVALTSLSAFILMKDDPRQAGDFRKGR